MPSLAEHLRQAREQRKLSVYDVAEATKIKTDHVRALEEGNYDAFAAPVYVRGFVRSYASYLKLDVAEVLKELEAELPETKPVKAAEDGQGLPPPISEVVFQQLAKFKWWLIYGGAGLVLAAVILAISYRAWEKRQKVDPFTRMSPGMYEPPGGGSGELLPLPSTNSAP